MYKTCNKCDKEKPLNSFAWKNKNKNTYQSSCKECHREYSKQHYKDNSSDYKKRAKSRRPDERKKIKEVIINHLEKNPCVDCGEKDIEVLEFDHIEMVGSKAIRVTQCTSIVSLLKEIEKCEVRCANCHTRRTRRMLGWSRTIQPR